MQANSYRASLFICSQVATCRLLDQDLHSCRAATALVWQSTHSCCVLLDSYRLLDPHCSGACICWFRHSTLFFCSTMITQILHTVPSRWIQNLTVCLPGSSNSWIIDSSNCVTTNRELDGGPPPSFPAFQLRSATVHKHHTYNRTYLVFGVPPPRFDLVFQVL